VVSFPLDDFPISIQNYCNTVDDDNIKDSAGNNI
jgi:hypothetical protein